MSFPFGEFTFEVDVFLKPKNNLILAEIELPAENTPFKKPEWLGEESHWRSFLLQRYDVIFLLLFVQLLIHRISYLSKKLKTCIHYSKTYIHIGPIWFYWF